MEPTGPPIPISNEATRTLAPSARPVLQLDHVDGIRGLLTIAILLAHVRTTMIYTPLKSVNDELFKASTVWMWPAFYVVGMFVAMSGYCLMLPVVRTRDGSMRGGTSDYLRRRARRMLPPFYAAMIISLIVSFLVPHNPYMKFSRAWTPGSLITHLFMVHNLSQNFRYSIDAPCWTVGAEWQLYVLYPLVLLPVWRRFGITNLIVLASILSLLPVLHGGDAVNFHSWYILIFAFGMCGAAIQYYDREEEVKWRKIVPWSKLSSILFSIFFASCVVDIAIHRHLWMEYIPTWHRFCFFETLMGVACMTLLVHSGQVLGGPDKGRRSPLMRILSFRAFTVIGMFSYSHYLMHYPVLMTIRWATIIFRVPAPIIILLMYFVAIPVSLSAGYMFFLLVESKCLPSHLRKSGSERGGKESSLESSSGTIPTVDFRSVPGATNGPTTATEVHE
jgi:peptidoglycan/LPS O-acetylase OafA/YrhL